MATGGVQNGEALRDLPPASQPKTAERTVSGRIGPGAEGGEIWDEASLDIERDAREILSGGDRRHPQGAQGRSGRADPGDASAVDDADGTPDARVSTKIDPSEVGFRSARDQFFGKPPEILNPALANGVKQLGVPRVMAIQYNDKYHTPVAVSEHVTEQRIREADTNDRPKTQFQLDLGVHPDAAGVDHDFGGHTDRFDRGHMAPSGDGASARDKVNTFRETNIVPQDSWHNERLWEGIESAVRRLARGGDGPKEEDHVGEGHDLYVVTGPSYLGSHIQSITPQREGGNALLVPTNIWKAVYDKTTGRAAVYWTENGARDVRSKEELSRGEAESNNFRRTYEVISVEEFTKRSGIDPFPDLDPSLKKKENMLKLPPPDAPKFMARRTDPQSDLVDVGTL